MKTIAGHGVLEKAVKERANPMGIANEDYPKDQADLKTNLPLLAGEEDIEKFDAEDYRENFGSSELTQQEIELLQNLWYIMCTFADIGWGVDAVQQMFPALFEKASHESSNLQRIPANGKTESNEK